MGSIKKNLLDLLSVPVLARTVKAFESCRLISSIVIVVPGEDIEFCLKGIVEMYSFEKVVKIAAGGKERQDSVLNGLRSAGQGWDYVVVHDGARPLVTPVIIEKTVKAAFETGATIAAVRVKDTIKEVADGKVKRTVPRESLWSVQTPQAFRYDILQRAFESAIKDGFSGTDESSLVERIGEEVSIVEGSYENIKITTPEDMVIAQAILRHRGVGD